MPTFGSFETDREVYSDPIYTVFSARKNGDPQSEYALKVFSIQQVGFDQETAADLAPLLVDIEDSRLQCIDLQAKTAATSRFVAPVFEKGQDERGVWYATRFYPRSVNKIIQGKVALTRETLQHLTRCVAQGALDLKNACGRSHGDIVPSNVQISRSEKLTEAEIVICDPLPGGEEEAVNFEINDLRSIGRILLQLVQQRAIGKEEDFLILPILTSPQWTRLFGKNADTWLSLCNRLLDPNLTLEEMTLERLISELDALQPKRKLPPKLLIGAAAALVVLAALTALLLRPRPLELAITSDPPGATILLDKQAAAQVTPTKLKLKKGTYLIEARQTGLGLPAQTTNLVVSAGGSSRLHFQFPYGMVVIKSDPPGATITAAGATLGKTPAEGNGFVIPVVPAGTEVKYELTLADHAPKTLNGTVTAGQRLIFSETLPLLRDVGFLEVDSTPSGAKVFSKDKLLISGTPDHLQLAQGNYVLRALYKDWPEKQFSVEVKSGTQISTNLYFEFGVLEIRTDPPGATVWAGTNNLGVTPLDNVRRPAGDNTLRFELAGFEPTNVTVRVSDKSRPSVRQRLVSDNGLFQFTSDPADALILDGQGKELGRTKSGEPLSVNLPPGSYSFTARINGLADVSMNFTIAKRQVKPYTFPFDYGSVSLTSDPPGAAISVDGRAVGFTPATLVQKPGVKVSYGFAAQDYLPVTTNVTVQSREFNRPVSARLLPEPVSVALSSDPPGAQFYLGTVPLVKLGTTFQLPWGTNLLTASNPLFPWLEPLTDVLVVKKGAANEKLFKFNYGVVSFETTPPDAGAGIFQSGKLLGHTPTNLYVRPGPAEYEVIYEDQTNRVAANVVKFALHPFHSTFEVKRDYTNAIGIVLVRVKDPLYVCKFEITQEQFQQIMGHGLEGKPRQPVVNVKWTDAEAFCQKLSQLDASSGGPKKAHLDGWTYGLPTQAEWSRFAETDPGQLLEAVFDSRLTEPKEIDPSRKSVNKSGLYDLYGNVAEWAVGASKQPVTIGGSFYNRKPRQVPADLMVETQNLTSSISDGSPNIGFRCVLRPPP
jgi:hypothetical protein